MPRKGAVARSTSSNVRRRFGLAKFQSLIVAPLAFLEKTAGLGFVDNERAKRLAQEFDALPGTGEVEVSVDELRTGAEAGMSKKLSTAS